MARKALNPYCKTCSLRKEGHCGGKYGSTDIPFCERYEKHHCQRPDPFGIGMATENAVKMVGAGIGGVIAVKTTNEILNSLKK